MPRFTFAVARIGGIPLRVHVLFLLLCTALVVHGGTAGGASRALFLLGLLLPAVVFLILHELGHALVAQRLGLPVAGIVLGPFVNLSALRHGPQRPAQEAWIALSGPAVNGVLGVLLATGSWLAPAGPAQTWLDLLARINLLLCLGNLLPVLPLDGGRLLRALLARRRPQLIATLLTLRVGRTLLLATPLALLWPTLRGSWPLMAALLLVVGFLLRQGRREEQRALVQEVQLQEEGLATRPGYRPLPAVAYRAWRPLCEEARQRHPELVGSASGAGPTEAGVATQSSTPAASTPSSSATEPP